MAPSWTESLPTCKIEQRGPISSVFLRMQIGTFIDAAKYVRALQYGRTSTPPQLLLVLTENRGTCSSKHALLAALAKELSLPLKLMLGIYEMSGENTIGVKHVLTAHTLECIPEAHCYLMGYGERFDFTRKENPVTPALVFLYEEELDPRACTKRKQELHQEFLKKWLLEQQLDLSFDEAWSVRERCIATLS